MTNESNAGERNEPANEPEKAQPTEAEIAAARLAQEIADGHRYMPQEMRDAKDAAGKPDRKGKGGKSDKKGADKKLGDKKAPAGGGDRIAKVMARAGIASRREIERLIGLGKVAVNGRILETPAVLVKPADVITVEGRVIGKAEPTRLFRYHKPVGLVTTERDPEGRPTVFDKLPKDLPRVLKVGRLDLNSEGLLLLTNDGELARALELPNTGWVRRYRVRALGHTTQAKLDALKDGTTVDGVIYGPIEATLDKAQEKADGRANLWLTVALTEGKNREVRKVLDSIGLKVNRLIRLAYGPFQLGNLEPGEVEEVGPRVIRELLSDIIDPRNLPPEGASQTRRAPAERVESAGRRGGGDRFEAGRGERTERVERKPARPKRDFEDKREFKERDFDQRPRFEGDGESRDRRPRPEGERTWTPKPERAERNRDAPPKKPWAPRPEGAARGERPERGDRPAYKKPYGAPAGGERPRKPYVRRDGDGIPEGEAGAYERAKREFGGQGGDKKPWTPRPERAEGGERKSYGDRPKRDFGDRPPREGGYKKPYSARTGGESKPYGDRPKRDFGDRPQGEGFKKPYARKPYTPRGEGAEGGERKAYGARSDQDRPKRDYGDRPQGEGFKKPYAKKPYTPRGEGGEGGERKSYGDRPKRDFGDRPQGEGFKKPYAPRGDRPAGKPGGFKSGPRPGGSRPAGRSAGPRKPRPE